MKKALVNIILVLSGLVLGVAACIAAGKLLRTQSPAAYTKSVSTAASGSDSVSDSEALVELAFKAAGFLRDGDYAGLSSMVHPEYGLTFSPYSNVNLDTARSFMASEVAAFGPGGGAFVWGVYDGSGEPIELNTADYISLFVFDKDYTNASIIGVDKVVKTGNYLENMATAFPGARFVELHDPGQGAEGLDWSTLRLVFEQYNGSWYLSAIVHSEWTA